MTQNVSEDQFKRLEGLSKELSKRLLSVVNASQKIIHKSLTELLTTSSNQFTRQFLQLGTISFNWQLYLQTRRIHVFFGFKRKSKFDNLMKTDLSLAISPIEVPDNIGDVSRLKYHWSPPPFLVVDPPKDLYQKSRSNGKKINNEHVLWMSTSDDSNELIALFFKDKEDKNDVTIYYFPNGLENPYEELKATDAPLSWYEKILSAVSLWNHEGYSPTLPINLAHSDIQIQTILKTISENFVEVHNELINNQLKKSKKATAISGQLAPFYQLEDYNAQLILRLNEEERVSTTSTKQSSADLELFQLGVSLKGHWLAGQPVIRFQIFPADFLTKGELFHNFLEVLLAEGKDELIKDLGINSELLDKTFSNPPEGTFIFRAKKKGKHDIEMFVIPIKTKGRHHTLIFTGKFEVDASENTVKYKGSFKNLIKEKDVTYKLENDGVKYFVQLLWQINQWKNKII